MSIAWRRVLVPTAILAAAVLAFPTSALELTTEENAPFNYQQGRHVAGIATDIVLEMGKRAGIPMNVQVLPWARAYRSALNYPNTCVYSTVRLPEREASFKWIGPLATNKWALFAKGDFHGAIHSIDDAKHYRIGGVAMDAKSAYLQSLGFNNIDLVADDNLNLAKLVAGRIDLWIAGLYRRQDPAVLTGGKAIKPVLVVRQVDYFLACNPKTPTSTVTALQQALHDLQQEGYVKSITAQYVERMK